MTTSEKKFIAIYFATVAVATGIYVVKSLTEMRRLSKRIKRSETFLAETEAFHAKYQGPAINTPEAIAEYQNIIDRYNA